MRAAIALVLLVGACVEDDDGFSGNLPREEQVTHGLIVDGVAVMPTDQADDDTLGVCDLLPADGICAHACDADFAEAYVPEGTCLTFACELTDGRQVLFCNCN